jgi:hypothetical protein
VLACFQSTRLVGWSVAVFGCQQNSFKRLLGLRKGKAMLMPILSVCAPARKRLQALDFP